MKGLAAAVLVLLSLTSGCVSMTPAEQATLREIKAAGLKEDQVQQKNAVGAGLLNLLPGVGNFYLAAGTEESAQWAWGVVNLLTWPISPAWGIPEAVVDGVNINKKATAAYYTRDPHGIHELAAIRNSQQMAGLKQPGEGERSP